MSICDLTTGFALSCRDNSGGVKKIYIAKFDAKTTYTETGGVISGMTSSNGIEFFQYDLQKNTADLSEAQSMTPENETIGYVPTINIVFNKLDTPKRNEMLLIARTAVVVIVEDRNGKYWLVGKEGGLDLGSSTRATGVAINDRNGSTLALSGSETEPFQEVQFSAFSALISSVQI
jgi:hypothetical protein